MNKFCNGHPTRKAHWHCPKCNALLCPECVSARESENYGKKENLHFCPKCNLPVEWVGLGNLIEPFWIRLPRMFTYPVYLPPLILSIIMAIATLVLYGSGFLSSLLLGIVFLFVLKYSFEALKATSSGDLRPPPLSAKVFFEDILPVFKQFIIYLIIGVASVFVNIKFGRMASDIFGLLVVFFLPSMIILIVTTGRLFHSINPTVFVGLAVRIGGAYFLMVFFLGLLKNAPTIVAVYLVEFVPQELLTLLLGFAVSFYTIISYHLMGYVILQYHEKIGFQVDFEDFTDPTLEDYEPQKSDPDAVILSKVEPLIKEGQLDEAIGVIKNLTQEQPISGIKLSERYYNLLKMKKRSAELMEHAVTHLDILTVENQKSKAISIFSECRTADSRFLPTAAALFKIAGWLNETGKTKAAVAVYNTLAKSYPDHALVPKAYFRIAQIFHDRLMNKDQAKKALGLLLQKYPNHDIVPQAESFLARL
jgi:hypothetical protein